MVGRNGKNDERMEYNKRGVIDLTAEGKTIRAVCDELNMDRRTLNRYLQRDEDFRSRFFEAKQFSVFCDVDEAKNIVDATGKPEDWVDDKVAVMRDKERANHRRWMAKQLLPEFGDKMDHTVSIHGGPHERSQEEMLAQVNKAVPKIESTEDENEGADEEDDEEGNN